ncbi:16306_t:CDS:2, partial [Racocetra persica]
TYEKTEAWGDKTFLGKLLSACQGFKLDFDPLDDSSEISWEEWVELCKKEKKTPTPTNFYLEQITRYLKRKEKEKAPVGSLTGLAIDKQKELAEGLIKA